MSHENLIQPVHAESGPETVLRSDSQASDGRLTRRETCIVNAAIKASNWSQRPGRAVVYNKPIAIDIDLPL